MKQPARVWSLLLHLALFAWLVVACLPIVWTAIISLRQYVDPFSVPVKWLAPAITMVSRRSRSGMACCKGR